MPLRCRCGPRLASRLACPARSRPGATGGGRKGPRKVTASPEPCHGVNIPGRYGAQVARGNPTESAMALATEQWLHPQARELTALEEAGSAKVLLVRDLAEPFRTRMSVSLRRIT